MSGPAPFVDMKENMGEGAKYAHDDADNAAIHLLDKTVIVR